MALISLGTVTIMAMFLWVFVSFIGIFRPMKHAKLGVAVGWIASVFWYAGVPV
jgi:hypothetical protein